MVGKPMSTRLCDGVEEDVIRNRVHDTEKLGVAGFMTEWYVVTRHLATHHSVGGGYATLCVFLGYACVQGCL